MVKITAHSHSRPLGVPDECHHEGSHSPLVVLSPANHLLAGRPQENGVLVLCRVAAPHVTERWVGGHDPSITQVLQPHQVLGLSQPVQPASTEGQGAKVLVDDS